MSTRFHLRGLALAASLIALPCAAAAQTGPAGYLVQALGDTSVDQLDDDQFSAWSDANEPTVAFAGQTIRIRFQTADAATASLVEDLGLGVEVLADGATAGTFTLSFQGQTTTPFFNGRFLTARDLTREQTYRPKASCVGVGRFEAALYRGGVRVATADLEDGVAPFVLDRIPDSFGAEPVVSESGHAKQIDIVSWSMDGGTATFDNGDSFAVDTVVVSAHELGHLLGLAHHIDAGTKSVSMRGVEEMLLEVESEGELEAIETLVTDQALLSLEVSDDGSGGVSMDLWSSTVGSVDVHNVADSINRYASITEVVASFQPEAGYQQRLRFRKSGGSWSAWSAWSTAKVLRRVAVPAPGSEAVDEFAVELRRSAAAPTIASSGYIRIKKLNSGG